MRIQLSLVAILLAAVACSFTRADEKPAKPQKQTPPYRIVSGKVDEATWLGWRAYHSACHACHGVDAVGTNVAPSLVERVANLSAREFTAKVITSYRITIPSGEMSGDDSTALREAMMDEVMRRESGQLFMPAWEHDIRVRPHVLDLYAYLRARADGALGPGRPERAAP